MMLPTSVIGTSIGPYQVLSKLGEGGMGEVYRARDSVLNRDVALKILPREFASDADRVARFRREAQVLAALNHPNIAHIYGVEDAAGAPALVLELVEGPTLADRIARGPLEIREALRIAKQIALALEAAHGQSIIHRDLKPANVKVRDDEAVKVLDFGLAKAFDQTPGATDELANSPTITNRATALGIILGTAAYMAPEQAKGKQVDRRADIWAFGVVMYEMLTGRRLFKGEDVSDTLADVLRADPDWRALPAGLPSSIQRLLRRCLVRDPRERLHDIADARLEIEDALAAPADAGIAPVSTSPRRERSLWIAAIVGAASIAAAAAWYLRPIVRETPPEMRLHLVTPTAAPFALSPDGRTMAYWTLTDGRLYLSVRKLDAEEARPLPGADGAGGFFAWSHDSRSILFSAGGTLKEVPVDGIAAAHPLTARANVGFGLSRNAEGIVLFAPANSSPLFRVPMNGATPEPATRIVPPQVGHRYPYFLPDGRHFLFLATGPPGTQGIYLGELRSLEARKLVEADTLAVFSPPDLVIFGRQDTIFAQRIDVQSFEPIGSPIRVADGVQQQRTVFGNAALSAAGDGTLAYRRATHPPRRLSWLDRTGRLVTTVGVVDTSESETPVRISADGREILISRRLNGNYDLWTIANTPQGALQRLTSDPAADFNGVWSPDGRRIAYQSGRRGGGFYDPYLKLVGGTGDDAMVFESEDNKTVHDWSSDGKFLLFGVQGREQVARDIWAIPVDGERKPFPVTKSPYDEISARFSPDSKWIAYQSNAAGPSDVYVRPFPGPGREWRISTGGGIAPTWRSDGKELYYVSARGELMAVAITLPQTGDAVDVGAPARLFTAPGISTYAPARDGKTFLVNLILEEPPTPPITVILNWRPK